MGLDLLSVLHRRPRQHLPIHRSKKVISYSLWGSTPMYTQGALRNLALQQQLFADWSSVFYVDNTVPEQTIQALREGGAALVIKPENIQCEGMFWRFEAVFDNPAYSHVLIRDADSRLTLREKDAVDEWLESGKPVHVMRDHPNHQHPMLGGMWGALPAALPWFETQYRRFRKKSNDRFWCDMTFLRRAVWKRVCAKALVHAAYCKMGPSDRDFRIQRSDAFDFVGNKYDEHDVAHYSVLTPES
jgi:hypothetical protein